MTTASLLPSERKSLQVQRGFPSIDPVGRSGPIMDGVDDVCRGPFPGWFLLIPNDRLYMTLAGTQYFVLSLDCSSACTCARKKGSECEVFGTLRACLENSPSSVAGRRKWWAASAVQRRCEFFSRCNLLSSANSFLWVRDRWLAESQDQRKYRTLVVFSTRAKSGRMDESRGEDIEVD